MVRSQTLTFTAEGKPPPADLESGSYRYVYHGAKSEFKDVDKMKQEIKSTWEQHEGITVDSIEIKQVPPHKIEPDYIWQEGATEITTEHTDLIVNFTVASPFPWALLLVAIIVIALVLIAYSPAFQKLSEGIYKVVTEFPWVVPLALVVILVVATGIKVPKRKEEGEG